MTNLDRMEFEMEICQVTLDHLMHEAIESQLNTHYNAQWTEKQVWDDLNRLDINTFSYLLFGDDGLAKQLFIPSQYDINRFNTELIRRWKFKRECEASRVYIVASNEFENFIRIGNQHSVDELLERGMQVQVFSDSEALEKFLAEAYPKLTYTDRMDIFSTLHNEGYYSLI